MLNAMQLQRVPLFSALGQTHLDLVATLAEIENHPKGTKLFVEGDPGDKFYMIIEGRVRISKIIPSVGEEALAVLDAGSYFGEMALVDESPRSAQAIAHTDVVLAAIDHTSFEQLLFINRELAYDVLWSFVRTLSRRLRETNDKIKSFFAMTGGF